MSESIYVQHAAEFVDKLGPTGEFVEVIEGAVVDAGGNVLYRGNPSACYLRRQKNLTQNRLVPIRTRRAVAGTIRAAEILWECAGAETLATAAEG